MEGNGPEAELPDELMEKERRWTLHMGLIGAGSIEDKSITTFARVELPRFVGINTFPRAPFAESVLEVANYDVTVLGIAFDGHTTYRPGVRFGPQGVRKISALYAP